MSGLSSVRRADTVIDFLVDVMRAPLQQRTTLALICQGLARVLESPITSLVDLQRPDRDNLLAMPITEVIDRAENFGLPDWLSHVPLQELQAVHVEDLPLLRHYGTTSDTAPHTITQVMPANAWRNSKMHALMRDLFAVDQVIAIPLQSGAGHVRLISAARSGLRVWESEMQLVRRIQPALLAIDRQLGCEAAMTSGPQQGAAWLDANATAGLTRREAMALALLAEGLLAQTIARKLGISTSTTNKHLENVYRKLGAHDRLGAVLTAQEIGLLSARETESRMGASGAHPGRA